LRSSVDVHNYLLDHEVPHELVPLQGPLRDLEDAPGVLGLEAAEVGRPTVLVDELGVVVVLAPADIVVDLGVVTGLLRRPGLAPLGAERSPGLTGYLLAAVPPVALDQPTEVVVDTRLAAQAVVYTAAGEAGVILKIPGEELVKATNAVVFPVSRA
jgi:prolyl-tRNA editing enzyme YbaK/EbsC (Cys-tRNA(Pro) deacylase)